MITKLEIDKLAEKYETVDFIKDDPVRVPHRFTDKKDIEIAGFMASLVAYGRRDVFIKKLNQLFEIAENEPYNFIMNFEPEILGDFNYRFGKPQDFAEIFGILRNLYEKDGGLEELFKYGYENPLKNNMFIPVTDYFYTRFTDIGAEGKSGSKRSVKEQGADDGLISAATDQDLKNLTKVGAEGKKRERVSAEILRFAQNDKENEVTDQNIKSPTRVGAEGKKFMLPDANKGSAMKRMCMFLRWMVRKGPVDFGIWDFMPTSDLFIPLDTHVARLSREMGLLTRKANDFKSVIEITENLKNFDPVDPIKYDFALFGYGVNN